MKLKAFVIPVSPFLVSLAVLMAGEGALEVEVTGHKVETPDLVGSDSQEGKGESDSSFEVLKTLLKHPEVIGAEKEVMRWKKEKRIALSPWFPNFSASFQWEDSKKYNHPTLGDQEQSRSVSRASFDQLLFDFGEGYFQYKVAMAEWGGRKANYQEVRERVVFEGLASALQSLLQKKLLDQAIASEKNFLKQKELEEQKVKGGQGFSTDVLQVEVQYLGAVAKVRQTRLDYESSLESTARWWGTENLTAFEGGVLEKLEDLITDLTIPNESDMSDLLMGSPSLEENKFEQMAMEQRKKALMGGRWGPKVSLNFLSQRGEELGGVGSYDREDRVSIQAELPLNLGGTSIDEVASLGIQLETLVENGRSLERELKRDLATALLTIKAKEDLVATRQAQMDVAQKYLEGAEKERVMGRRSLIDVLNGELLRLQAESEMERARVDRVVAWCRFWQLSGRLGHILEIN